MARAAGREPRLDPVRWQPPDRRRLLRVAAVAVLLLTAAALYARGPTECRPAGSGTGPAAEARPADGAPDAEDDAAGSAGAPAAAVSGPDNGGPVGPDGSPVEGRRLPVPPGTVGVPVPLADPAAAALLGAGDRVDLLRLDGGDRSDVVAADALVLGTSDGGSALLVAVGAATARRMATAPAGTRYTALVRPP